MEVNCTRLLAFAFASATRMVAQSDPDTWVALGDPRPARAAATSR